MKLFLTCFLLFLTVNVYAANDVPEKNDQLNPISKNATEILNKAIDKKDWIVVKYLFADLGKDIPDALVVLLKSAQVKGYSGAGGEQYEVNLIIIYKNNIIYSSYGNIDTHRQPRTDIDSKYLLDDSLKIKDVTGDSIPEIIFNSGHAFASGFINTIHVLSYIPSSEQAFQFRDIADVRFYFSSRHSFNWLDMNGTVYAIVAEGLDSKISPISPTSPRYYQYLMLRWDNTRKTFIIAHSILSRSELNFNPTAMQSELDYIKKVLKDFKK